MLFDPYYVLYYAGFAFAPTERPIAFVLGADGRAGTRRAAARGRARAGHARRSTASSTTSSIPVTRERRTCSRRPSSDLGLAGKIGADQDGYPWILGYRGPTLSELSGATVVRVVAGRSRSRWRSSPRPRSQLIRESVRWGNLAHRLLQRYTRPGRHRDRGRRSARATRRRSPCSTRSARSTAHRASSRAARTPATAGQIGRNSAIPHALAGNIVFQAGRRPRHRRERARLGLPLRARADDGRSASRRRSRSGCSPT